MKSDSLGSALLETLIVFPTMMLIIFGLIQLSLYYHAVYMVQLGTFKAARMGFVTENKETIEEIINKYCRMIKPAIKDYKEPNLISIKIHNTLHHIEVETHFLYKLLIPNVLNYRQPYRVIKSKVRLEK